MKNVKALLKKCFDSKECFETVLAEFRIASREDGYSPAELFYKRQVIIIIVIMDKFYIIC